MGTLGHGFTAGTMVDQFIINEDEISELSVNQVNLISDGLVTLTETDLFELEGNESVEESIGEFEFTGTAAPSDSENEVNPSFKLVLSFASVLDEEE